MQLINNTPYPALAFHSTDQHGQSFHVVVMRATLDIQNNGTATLSHEQEPFVLTDEYFGELNKSSVRQESDLVHFKPKCDVIVNATAYAPSGKPSPGFTVGVRIHSRPEDSGRPGPLILEKKLLVTGPRFWEKGLMGGWTIKPSTTPITSLPLRYEYAYGGESRVNLDDPDGNRIKPELRLSPEQRNKHPDGPDLAPIAHTIYENNPLGLGFADEWHLKAKKLKKIPAQQIDDPIQPITVFGKTTLPEDFNMSYWNGAHPDMQVPYLSGDEKIVLTNLTPAGSLSFRLPGQQPILKCTSADGKTLSVPANLDTLIIEPDESKVTLVWRAVLTNISEIAFVETSDTC